MQIQQLQCNQVFKSETDTLEVVIFPYFEGSMVELYMEDFAYYVPFKDVSFSKALSTNGVLLRAFKHMLKHPERAVRCIPDIIDRFNQMKKVSESYFIQYHPISINHISSSFSIEASGTKEGSFEVDVSVTTYKGKMFVDYGHIQAQNVNDLLEKCERYCTDISEIIDLMIA